MKSKIRKNWQLIALGWSIVGIVIGSVYTWTSGGNILTTLIVGIIAPPLFTYLYSPPIDREDRLEKKHPFGINDKDIGKMVYWGLPLILLSPVLICTLCRIIEFTGYTWLSDIIFQYRFYGLLLIPLCLFAYGLYRVLLGLVIFGVAMSLLIVFLSTSPAGSEWLDTTPADD